MLNIIKLARERQTIRLRAGGSPLRLGREGGRVLKGEAWVTVKGVFEDLILREGEALPCCSPEIVVEALSTELVLEISGPSVPGSPFSVLRSRTGTENRER